MQHLPQRNKPVGICIFPVETELPQHLLGNPSSVEWPTLARWRCLVVEGEGVQGVSCPDDVPAETLGGTPCCPGIPRYEVP